jgi:hypothetical protein
MSTEFGEILLRVIDDAISADGFYCASCADQN